VFNGYYWPIGIVGISGVHLLILNKTPIKIGEKMEPAVGVEPTTS
tara:strand:+ start:30 stop:164 length:135 start_codon:yes stop_codon:yes gene_type:complete